MCGQEWAGADGADVAGAGEGEEWVARVGGIQGLARDMVVWRDERREERKEGRKGQGEGGREGENKKENGSERERGREKEKKKARGERE